MPGQDASGMRDGCISTSIEGEFRQPKFESGCWVCGVRQTMCVFSFNSNRVLDDRIFYCLLISMAAVPDDL